MKMIYRPTVLTLIGVAATLAAISGTAGFILGRMSSLPPLLAVHFDNEGIADRFVRLSYAIALVPVWIQLTLAVVFGLITGVLLYRTHMTRSAVEDSAARQERERMLITAEAICLLSAVWVAFQGLVAVRLLAMWQRMCCGLGDIYYQALVVFIVLSIVIGIRAAVYGQYPTPVVRPTQDGHWFRGLYINRNDPAVFVPLRNGGGWTLNLGRPQAIVALGVFVALSIWAPLIILRVLLGE
jgi:uncharacterized membrane protein